MICKYCSAKMDPNSDICPNCGKRGNAIKGGNGFWDIARGPVQEKPPEVFVVREPQKRKMLIPFVICGTLCFLSLIIAVVGIIKSNQKINTIISTYETQLLEQTDIIEGYSAEIQAQSEHNANLQSQIDQLEQRVAELETTSASAEGALHILSSPTSETRSIGFCSSDKHYLFGLHAEGAIITFRWEKQEPDGSWSTIVFDEKNINKELGLRLDQSISEGTTKLAAVGLTPLSFGVYKCIVIGENSIIQSAAVDLINSDDSETADENTDSTTEDLSPVYHAHAEIPSLDSNIRDDNSNVDDADMSEEVSMNIREIEVES